MAILITDKLYKEGGYADSLMGPYETLADLGNITDRFEGLTVTVLEPIVMECWLVGGTRKTNWKVKQFSSIETYAKLLEYTSTIFTSFSKLIAVGTEATVLADENSEGKMTKYWVTKIEGSTITWEKMIKGDGDYVPVNCVTGSDVENS